MLLEIYTDQYSRLQKKIKIKTTIKNRPKSLSLEGLFSEDDKALDGDMLLESEKEEIVDITLMPPLELDEEEFVDIRLIASLKEVNEDKRLKFLTPNKLLTRLPILLAQIKATKNSWKLNNGIRQILYLFYQQNKITNKLYNNLMKSL